MDGKMFHYVYRITNKILNKHYYGCRTSKIEPKLDLSINYFSSSKDKKFLLDQKENQLNYKYKIIKIFKERVDAIGLEIKLHNKFNVGKNVSFYNKAKQTSKKFDTSGIPHSSERKKAMSLLRKGTPQVGGVIKHSEATKKKLSIAGKGKTHSKETKKKMSENHIGEKNPFYGKKHSEEAKKKMAESAKNQVRPLISEETRIKMKNAHKGKKLSEQHKINLGINSKDRLWFNKDNKTIMIKHDEIQKYIDLGWSRGRKCKK